MFLIICDILFILCVPNVKKYSYIYTVSVQLYPKQEGGVVGVLGEHTVSYNGLAMVKNGGYLGIFIHSYNEHRV